MALVNIINVTVHDNPTSCTNPFIFEIIFECIQPLKEDLEWKVIYVGSAEDSQYDQALEEVLVGPVAVGINKFVLQAPAPDYSKIKNEDLLGVTVTLVTCSYVNQEFVRIGYYVNNEYSDPYDPAFPPAHVEISKVFRNILAGEPRVTRFAIDWSGNSPTVPIEAGPEEEEIQVNENEEVMDFDKMDDGADEDEDEDDESESEEEEDVNAEVDLNEEDDADENGENEEDIDGESEGDEENDDEGDEADDMDGPFASASTLPPNEDSMDVGMMQQYAESNNFSNQGIF